MFSKKIKIPALKKIIFTLPKISNLIVFYLNIKTISTEACFILGIINGLSHKNFLIDSREIIEIHRHVQEKNK